MPTNASPILGQYIGAIFSQKHPVGEKNSRWKRGNPGRCGLGVAAKGHQAATTNREAMKTHTAAAHSGSRQNGQSCCASQCSNSPLLQSASSAHCDTAGAGWVCFWQAWTVSSSASFRHSGQRSECTRTDALLLPAERARRPGANRQWACLTSAKVQMASLVACIALGVPHLRPRCRRPRKASNFYAPAGWRTNSKTN